MIPCFADYGCCNLCLYLRTCLVDITSTPGGGQNTIRNPGIVVFTLFKKRNCFFDVLSAYFCTEHPSSLIKNKLEIAVYEEYFRKCLVRLLG